MNQNYTQKKKIDPHPVRWPRGGAAKHASDTESKTTKNTLRARSKMVPRWSQDGPRPQEITGECYLRNTLPNAASSIFFVCTGASGMTQHAQNPFPSSSENSKQPKKVRQTQTSTFGAAYLGTVLIAEFKATTSAYKHNQLQGEHPHPPQSPKTKHNGRTTSNLVIGSDRGKKKSKIFQVILTNAHPVPADHLVASG